MFAKRILVGPELLGHGFVDDGNRRSFFAVGIGELAAAEERHLQSVEVSWSDLVKSNFLRLLTCHVGMFLNPNAVIRAHVAHGNSEGFGDGLDTGKGAN